MHADAGKIDLAATEADCRSSCSTGYDSCVFTKDVRDAAIPLVGASFAVAVVAAEKSRVCYWLHNAIHGGGYRGYRQFDL